MKTLAFLVVVIVAGAWLIWRRRMPPSRNYDCIDAIVPAFNEELCIADTVRGLLASRYINRVIVVDDGSTDGTAAILKGLAVQNPRLHILYQTNTGKSGALTRGLSCVQAPHVFLTDADTVLPQGDGLGYLLAEIERGADAVGGVPASNLNGAGLLPHIRATLKLPMIALKRTFQQLLGGAPFFISGACGLFKTEVLRTVPFSDRTKVEDLDMTWSLVAQGYTIRQSTRCIVYAQECNSVRAEWLRWRRWIIGYAVCMRLHWKLLFSRFGLFSILPMFLVVLVGLVAYAASIAATLAGGAGQPVPLAMFSLIWAGAAYCIGAVSALHYRQLVLMALAPAAIFYVLLAYAIWLIHGFRGLITGVEPKRDKPLRYAHVVA